MDGKRDRIANAEKELEDLTRSNAQIIEQIQNEMVNLEGLNYSNQD